LFDNLICATASFKLNENAVCNSCRRRYVHVSWSCSGLAHDISVEESDYTIQRGQTLSIEFDVRNTGSAEWLAENAVGIGVVNSGAHLYDQNLQLLSLDFCRQDFDRNTIQVRTFA
jgi:cephalosporin hydroxylase